MRYYVYKTCTEFDMQLMSIERAVWKNTDSGQKANGRATG